MRVKGQGPEQVRVQVLPHNKALWPPGPLAPYLPTDYTHQGRWWLAARMDEGVAAASDMAVIGLGVYGVGLGVQGLGNGGSWSRALGFGVQDSGHGGSGFRIGVEGSRYRISSPPRMRRPLATH